MKKEGTKDLIVAVLTAMASALLGYFLGQSIQTHYNLGKMSLLGGVIGGIFGFLLHKPKQNFDTLMRAFAETDFSIKIAFPSRENTLSALKIGVTVTLALLSVSLSVVCFFFFLLLQDTEEHPLLSRGLFETLFAFSIIIGGAMFYFNLYSELDEIKANKRITKEWLRISVWTNPVGIVTGILGGIALSIMWIAENRTKIRRALSLALTYAATHERLVVSASAATGAYVGLRFDNAVLCAASAGLMCFLFLHEVREHAQVPQ